jgi:hypothetical protein
MVPFTVGTIAKCNAALEDHADHAYTSIGIDVVLKSNTDSMHGLVLMRAEDLEVLLGVQPIAGHRSLRNISVLSPSSSR